jgi:hypothetical protein
MNLATWKSIKSPIMQEIRVALKKKPEKGQPTPSNKDANRTWREEILGFLSEEQKKEKKSKNQEKNKKVKIQKFENEEQDENLSIR